MFRIMLSLKINKEKNKMIKLLFNILFILFIVFNSMWNIKKMAVLKDPIGSLLYGLIPLYSGIFGSWRVFNKFKNKDSWKFALGTILSAAIYYVFWYLGVAIMFLIAVISIFFE